MGKKKQQKQSTDESAASNENTMNDGDENYEEDELELLQVDLGDMVKLKQVLDESVAHVLLEKLDEDYRWDNCKLMIMTAACLFAVVAQFAPLPFPESRPILGVCGCAYFALSGVLQLISTFIDRDSILLTKPKSSSKGVKNDLLSSHGVRVRSSLPRFSEWYTVVLEFQMEEASPFVEQRWSVGQFFDKEGYFDEIGLMEEVENIYKRFEQGKYDKQLEEKKQQ